MTKTPYAKDAFAMYPSLRASILETGDGVEHSADEQRARIQTRKQWLKEQGVQSGQRVLLEARTSLDFFISLFALGEIGAVAFLSDPDQTPSERANLLERVSPHFALGPASGAVPKIEKLRAEMRPPLPPETAFVLLTSGTSAQPKAVIHRFQNLEKRFESGARAIPFEQRARALCLLPTYFGHGLIGVCLQTLFYGECLILPTQVSVASFGSVHEWVDRFRVSFISGTPATWNLVLRMSPRAQQKTLRRAQIASAHSGETLFDRVRQWAQTPVWNVYGLTETASWISDRLIHKGDDESNVGDGHEWGTRFRILHPDDQGFGEIAVQTESLFAGYWGEWTAETSVMTEFETRDIGRLNADGSLQLAGRLSRVINRGGLKISPEEIELEIKLASAIEDAIVVEVPNARGISGIGAMIVLNSTAAAGSAAPIIQEIEGSLRSKLSPQKIPTVWRVVEKIPRRPNGKPDLKEIGLLWNRLANS